MSRARVLLDAHVHVYACADAGRLLDAAHSNFRAAARTVGAERWDGVLLLTETAHDHWFASVRDRIVSRAGAWQLRPVPSDPTALWAHHEDGGRLAIIAGRQINTRERLEVHALGIDAKFPDDLSLVETVGRVTEAGAFTVIPWGVGKWSGARGRILASYLAQPASRAVAVSDIGGRPAFWKAELLEPSSGRLVLRGSDPLPMTRQEGRVGAFGSCLDGPLDDSRPGQWCLERLRGADANSVRGFGGAESVAGFIRNQLRLRLQRS